MCVCVCVHACACVHVHAYVCVNDVDSCTHMHAHTHTHTHMHTHAHTHTHTHTHVHARTGSQDGTVHVWSGETGQKVTVLDGGHPGPTYNLQFNPKLMMAASACNSVVSRVCCGCELPSKWKESSLVSRLHPQMREKWGSIFCLGERGYKSQCSHL